MLNKLLKIVFTLVVLVGVFAGGYVIRAMKHPVSGGSGRRVLYYVDAMNPAYRSDKPGIAPDGMALQPVYADETATADGNGRAHDSLLP